MFIFCSLPGFKDWIINVRLRLCYCCSALCLTLIQTWRTLHEFQRDGITICTTFTPFKPENTRLLARKNDIIIDIRVMYDHSKGKTLILSKNISLLVTMKGV